jgi:hypothetical protein
MKNLRNASIAASLLAISVPGVAGTGNAGSYRLFFPSIALEKDERITGVKVEVTCGYIRGVKPAPDDWGYLVRSPISSLSTLEASAGHGASWLWSIREWNGAVHIAPYDLSCFDVAATVYSTFYQERDNERSFNRRQLKLRP